MHLARTTIEPHPTSRIVHVKRNTHSVSYHRTGRGIDAFFNPRTGELRSLFPDVSAFLKWLGPRSFLDVGCGEGNLVQGLAPLRKNIHGVDIVLSESQHHSRLFTAADAFHLPFGGGAFDVLFCSYSVFHYEPFFALATVTRSCTRIVSENGVLLIPGLDRIERVRLITREARDLGMDVLYHEPSRTLLCTRK